MKASLTRWRSLVFLVVLLTSVVVGTSACQSTSAAVDTALARDLGMVDPAAVGVSAERLERLDRVMQGYIDREEVAGVVTLVARRGKVVHFSSLGERDAVGSILADIKGA